MSVSVITPPQPIITFEEAARHLRLGSDQSEKILVEGLVAAATGHIDGPDGWLGRAIGEQELEATFDAFIPTTFALPFPPIVEVIEIKYVDADGVKQVLPPAAFTLKHHRLAVAFGSAWPATRAQHDAVSVTYLAGYDQVPAPIKAAILLMTTDLYENRGTTTTGVSVGQVPMSTTVEKLLAPFRIYR